MKGKRFKRSHRVGESIFRETALIIKNKIKDPRIKNLVITGVQLSDDLRQARIFFDLIGLSDDADPIAAANRALEKAKGFIRHELADHIMIRFVPELVFVRDESLDTGRRIDSILMHLREENA